MLFLITRYTPFFQSLLFLYSTSRSLMFRPVLTNVLDQVWLDVSPETCYHTYLAATCKSQCFCFEMKLTLVFLGLIVLSMNIAESECSYGVIDAFLNNTFSCAFNPDMGNLETKHPSRSHPLCYDLGWIDHSTFCYDSVQQFPRLYVFFPSFYVSSDRHVIVSTPPYPGYRGCFIVGTSGVLIWNYIILIIIEAGMHRFY